MALTASIVAAVSAVGSGVAQNRAQKAQNKAQKRAAELERANARIQQQREVRKAIAQSRIQRAEILASAEAENSGSNSAVQGAVGALQSDTATAVGSSNVNLASRTGQSRALQRGATKSVQYGTIASGFQAIGSIASSYNAFKTTQETTNPPLVQPGSK
tara:strand:+ start:1693 stop:2169 length:477 start_codon:yes stop_codon:yes gene_type:complete